MVCQRLSGDERGGRAGGAIAASGPGSFVAFLLDELYSKGAQERRPDYIYCNELTHA